MLNVRKAVTRGARFYPCASALAMMSVSAVAMAQTASACTELEGFAPGIEQARITTASLQNATNELPAHCLLSGIAQERVGIDGEQYAIKFEMRLPESWNGGFVHQFNGGTVGSVLPATGSLLGSGGHTALARGYAVMSHDAGHDNDAQPEWGHVASYRFGLDPQARVNYGYGADLIMTDVAKAIITERYRENPARSYGVGCSNGGRSAMIMATRVPDAYDGFLVGAPGFNLPRASLRSPWEIQHLNAINGDVRTAFSAEDLQFVAGEIRNSCDALDGLEDGMVLDVEACQAAFDINSLQCSQNQEGQCLSEAQTTALQAIHDGPQTSDGTALYSDWPWDIAIGGGGYRFLRIRSGVDAWDNLPLNVARGGGTPAYIFGTPPDEVEGTNEALLEYLLNFDMDRGGQRIQATDDTYTESALSFMRPLDADDPTMADFRAAGGKMVVYHGTGDAVFSSNDTQAWFEKLAANHNGTVGEFASFYPVPGMGHCSGGPATDNFDLFETLVDWVENDVPPGDVEASINPENNDIPDEWASDRSRLLCQYPKVARYVNGNPEEASSFTCSN